jgi:hypothetical protein
VELFFVRIHDCIPLVYTGISKKKREKMAAWLGFLTPVCGLALLFFQLLVKMKVDAIAKTARETHALVNGAAGAGLRLTAAYAARIAVLTKTPEDIEAAEEAQRTLAQYNMKQKLLQKISGGK